MESEKVIEMLKGIEISKSTITFNVSLLSISYEIPQNKNVGIVDILFEKSF